MKKITDEVIGRILSDIAKGGTLRESCTREGIGYHRAWRMLTKSYSKEYTQAKECGVQLLVDMALTRAMNSTSETAKEDAMFCGFVIWLAERRLSQEYGDRRNVTTEKGPSFILEGDLLVSG